MNAAQEPDYQLVTFADRLLFTRAVILRIGSASEFARRCGFAASTYPTWEDGTKPRDKVEIAETIAAAFPGRVSAHWLLHGGGQLRMKLTHDAAA